ncbi:MAG: porin family protein, partial [bacterium]|nr:porin family protein [bacterium]
MNHRANLICFMTLLPLSIVNAQWYAGAQIGANFVSVSKALTYPLVSDSPITHASYQSGYSGFHGQILAGDTLAIKGSWRIAIEGAIDWFTGSSSYTINNWFQTEGARAKEQLNYGFGLYLIPEYQYNESIRFFGGPGLSSSQFAIKSGSSAGNVGVTG